MKKELNFFDVPRNRKIVRWILFGLCFLLLALGFFWEFHSDLYWEKAPNFYAAYGFISCVFLVLIAKFLRKVIKREEKYYDQ